MIDDKDSGRYFLNSLLVVVLGTVAKAFLKAGCGLLNSQIKCNGFGKTIWILEEICVEAQLTTYFLPVKKRRILVVREL